MKNEEASAGKHVFLLQANDVDALHPVLEAQFEAVDLRALQTILGQDADDDPNIDCYYVLEDGQLPNIIAAFNASFDLKPLGDAKIEVWLSRVDPRAVDAPYLIHTGWELPLLLNGDKKLAVFGEGYPPMTFEGEDRFDEWVSKGVLHKAEFLETWPVPSKKWLGIRHVYYALKGEEWRIPAMRLLWEVKGWNETLERLESMLFGYQDWQTDWWIEHRRKRGGIGGISLCCGVTASGLDWLKSAGHRALPPCEKPCLDVIGYDSRDPKRMRAFLLEDQDNVALVCFVIFWPAGWFQRSATPPYRWSVESDRIPELNGKLENRVAIAMWRDDTTHPAIA